MTAEEPRAGVCIIRVEPQPTYLLITITVHRHVGQTVFSALPQLERKVADPDQALNLVAGFLASFLPPPGRS